MHPSTTPGLALKAAAVRTSNPGMSKSRLSTGLLAMLLWVGLPAAAAAQQPAAPGRIVGLVKSVEGEPLARAGITLRAAADSALVSGALTDDNGRFRVDGLMPGRYLLRVSTAGYKPRNSEVIELTMAAPQVDLGTIELEISAVALDAIEAAAERDAVVMESDRTTYNVKAMPVASGGTVIDVLRAVPELEVDINNNVKLRGSQAVAVHLNGRPTPMQGEQLANFLQQLPGNRVDRVEVLPNPSAKHDPEGMGGIVNIVLQQNVDLGLSGSLSANMSSTRRGANGRLNYQKGRLALFSGSSIYRNRWEDWNHNLRRNMVTQPVTVIDQNSSSVRRMPGWNLDWTTELKVGRQAHLWSNGYMSSATTASDGRTAYLIADDANFVRDSYDRLDARTGGFDVSRFGGGFKQVFQQRTEELTVDGSLWQRDDVNSLLQEKLTRVRSGESVDVPLEHILNDIDSGSRNLSVQADYFRPLGGGRLEVGVSSWRRSNGNENQLFNTSHRLPGAGPDVHSGYDYAETVGAAYTTLSQTFGKFSAQGGLRLEHSGTTFESRVADASFDRGYTSLFPSFNVMYSPKPGRSARLLFSQRIARPYPAILDPFVPSTDPLSVSRGNPDLQPQYTNSYSADLSYSGGRGTIRVAPYYRRTSNIWERIRIVDENGVATNSWLNGSHSETLGSNFTLSLRSAGRLSGSTNLNLRHEERNGTNIAADLQRSAVLWSAGGNLAFKVTPTLTAQVFGERYSAQPTLQGRSAGYSFSSLALRQQLWGTKGSITLNVSDPLNLSSSELSSWNHSTYTQTSRSNYQTRFATLAVTYNFGKPPQQQSRRSAPEEAGETIRVP
jgi:ferric enterobactin receptor